jgi:8-oxo-dGTP diphosphatase
MALYLVRHGKAGRKSQWNGPDMSRPLDDAGRMQARELAPKIVAVGPTRLVSSPYFRCMETLRDLSELTGLPILADERLAEAGDITSIIQMLEQEPDGAVICSHGDMIPAIIRTLENRGMTITTTPDWRKASVWVIERNGATFTTASAWPPPLTS